MLMRNLLLCMLFLHVVVYGRYSSVLVVLDRPDNLGIARTCIDVRVRSSSGECQFG